VLERLRGHGLELADRLLFEEVYTPRLIPNFEQIAEVDLYGRPGRSTCLNNPHARTFIVSMVEDWFKSNPLDGLMWESERQGPLNNLLGMNFTGVNDRTTVNCFCGYCARKGKEQGIDVERVQAAPAVNVHETFFLPHHAPDVGFRAAPDLRVH